MTVLPFGTLFNSWEVESFPERVFFQEGPGLRKWQWTESGMKVINVTNILGDGSVDPSNTDRFISLEEFEKKYRHFAIQAEDIVVASSGNTYGKLGRIKAAHLPLMMNTSVVRFRPKADTELDADYLYAYLRSQFFSNQVEAFVVGSAQPNFGPTHIKRMQLVVPPLDTQRRIASILSAYDDLIENNTRRIAILEEMARRIYEEWFVRFRFPGHENVRMVESELGLVPEGWRIAPLGDLVDDVRDTVSPASLTPDTPYVGLEHIPRRSIALAEWGRAADVQSTKLRFHERDILFGKIRPYFHKVAVAPLAGVASSDAIVIRPKSEDTYGLALAVVSSDGFVAEATQTSNGTKMPRANWTVLQRYPVPIAPASLRMRFEQLMDGVVSAVGNHVMRNRNLRTTRDLLLPKLISGELDVSAMPSPEVAAA